MAPKALVLTTLRDRDTHWRVFKLYMAQYFPELTVAIIQQADTKSWNKGLLYNAGYSLLAKDYDYVVLHDIDFVPVVGKVDYSFTSVPCMIAGAASQFNYQLYYPTFFGGVVVCSKEHYELVNGFSNLYRGYGGEDDGLRNAFIAKGITPTYKMGKFECFAHPKPDIKPGSQFYNTPEYQHNLKLCLSPRDFTEGLSNCSELFDVQSIHEDSNYKHIKLITK